MEPLGGLDAAFVAMETPSMHLHVGAVMVLEGADGRLSGEEGFFRIRSLLAERLHLAPFLRRRVVKVPFGVHHPVWIEDPRFDLDYHLRRVSLPSPGGIDELARLTAEVLGHPLDLERPPWELYVVEGLSNGGVGLVAKVHHAAMDGVSGAGVMAALMDLEQDPPPVAPPERPWVPEQVPSPVEMLLHGISALGREPETVASILRRGLDAATRLRAWSLDLADEGVEERPPAPFSAPRTSLNGAISPHRRVALVSVPLADVIGAARVLDSSVNEVLLGSVAGALGRLLSERGEHPERPLVAMVPVSTRRARSISEGANQVSGMLVALDTAIADPRKRMEAVTAASRLAKSQARLLSPELLSGVAEVAFPAIAGRAARLASNVGVFDHFSPPCNVVVSNVRGPKAPLWCAGARLDSVYPAGPVIEGVGLNITALSYTDGFHVGLVGCRELVPDLGSLASHLRSGFEELAELARRT